MTNIKPITKESTLQIHQNAPSHPGSWIVINYQLLSQRAPPTTMLTNSAAAPTSTTFIKIQFIEKVAVYFNSNIPPTAKMSERPLQ